MKTKCFFIKKVNVQTPKKHFPQSSTLFLLVNNQNRGKKKLSPFVYKNPQRNSELHVE